MVYNFWFIVLYAGEAASALKNQNIPERKSTITSFLDMDASVSA
jgi:hypothetical protein